MTMRSVPRAERLAAWSLAAVVVAVVVVPLLARDPLRIDDVLARRLVAPFGRDAHGGLHLLGTDRFGRDLAARMLLAGRLSLLVGIVGAVLSGALGTLAGALAGWRGGLTERAVLGLADVLLALPRLVLLLVGVALWQPGLATIMTVLVATGWMGVARLVRAEVVAVRERPYVPAAQALGATGWRVLWRHVLPNAIGPAIVATTLGVGNAILLESGLSFLGLGIQPPAPSWGNMIAGGRDLLVVAPWVSLAPGIALVLTVLATSVLGDALRDRLAGEG
ncbi:MAG: ABC-type transporter, integral rane subunit [Gemmatimonadetes bacterium]|jgi:peptide/nickel transport system permease protein|nr:ABC-type transporter, integral rane subunit [Gemmatimonadota bacterium]